MVGNEDRQIKLDDVVEEATRTKGPSVSKINPSRWPNIDGKPDFNLIPYNLFRPTSRRRKRWRERREGVKRMQVF